MSIEIIHKSEKVVDPMAAIEAAADHLDFEKERVADGEIHVMLPSVWRDIGLWFTWREDLSTLQMGAPIDLKAPANREGDASRLVTMVNERLWAGHF